MPLDAPPQAKVALALKSHRLDDIGPCRLLGPWRRSYRGAILAGQNHITRPGKMLLPLCHMLSECLR